MKICIFGAGAIGGYMAAKLAAKGDHEVSVVARGAHLEAMKANGLTLKAHGETLVTHPKVAASAAELGAQDYVVITLKAHGVPPAIPQIMPLLGPQTALVMGVNGVPWWYFHGLTGPFEGRRLASVDPGDVQWNAFGPERVIGCVVYPAAEVPEPGVVELVEGDRFSLGEPDGQKTERVTKLSQALIDCGLKAPVRPKIRDEIWVKLWGNLSFNPISALTHATLVDLIEFEGTRTVARNMMLEAQGVAEKLGVKFPIDVDKRLEGGRQVGAHKTSMLQDLERKRPMEIEALVGAVKELGEVTGTPTPTIDTVLALIRLRAIENAK
jgi:2-dehydropantoate 2-reductase